MKIYSYQVNFQLEEEGGYTVTVPALSGCVSYGKTIEEATKNVREAIELHLENLAAHHQPIPKEENHRPFYTTLINVNLPDVSEASSS